MESRPPQLPNDRPRPRKWLQPDKDDPLSLLPIAASQTLAFMAVFGRSPRLSERGLFASLAIIFGWLAIALAVAVALMWWDRRLHRAGRSWRWRAAVPALAVVVGTLAAPVVLGTPLTRAIATALGTAAFFGGFFAIGLGLRWPVRSRPACVKCGYERGEVEPLPNRCPECGAVWIVAGGIAALRHERRPWIVAGGIAACAAGFLLAFARDFLPMGVAASAMPTRALILAFDASSLGADGAWTELQSRTLTPDEHEAVARVLLDRRRRGDLLPRAASNWLDAQAAMGTMPPELLERFFAEMLDVRLEAPSRARVGEPFEVRLQGHRRGHSLGYRAGAALAGFFVGDSGTARAHTHQLIPDHELSPHLPDQNPRARITPEHAGPLRVRATVWIVVVTDTTWNVHIDWADDGTPILPPSTVWSKRLDLEATVLVRP